jgi:hypothetical protein
MRGEGRFALTGKEDKEIKSQQKDEKKRGTAHKPLQSCREVDPSEDLSSLLGV